MRVRRSTRAIASPSANAVVPSVPHHHRHDGDARQHMCAMNGIAFQTMLAAMRDRQRDDL